MVQTWLFNVSCFYNVPTLFVTFVCRLFCLVRDLFTVSCVAYASVPADVWSYLPRKVVSEFWRSGLQHCQLHEPAGQQATVCVCHWKRHSCLLVAVLQHSYGKCWSHHTLWNNPNIQQFLHVYASHKI